MSKNIYWKKNTEVLIINDNTILINKSEHIFLINEIGIGIAAKLIGSDKSLEIDDFYVKYFLNNSFAVKHQEHHTSNHRDDIVQLIKKSLYNDIDILFSDEFIPSNNTITDKNSLLLIRFYNNTVSIGPLFSEESDKPCINCLTYRLKWNNPIYSLKHKINSALFINNGQFRYKNKAWLSCSIKKYLSNNDMLSNDSYISFNSDKESIEKHPVIKRPQCPSCGDPDIFPKQSLTPFDINKFEQISSFDGGVRVISPIETIRNINSFISRESGLITYITPDETTDDSNNYRCVFHKSPYNNKELKNTNLVQVTVGKGVNLNQSKASAMGEAIERLAANYSGDEICFFSKPIDLKPRHYSPEQLAPFSMTQFKSFLENPNNESYQLYSTYPYNEEKIHWSPVWSLSNKEKVYLPSNYCFDNTPFISEPFSKYYQNGCSAGNTLSEAILQGIFEIIERDAISIWWYNRIKREQVDYSRIDSLVQFSNQNIDSKNWEHWVLDIQHDFKVPVFAAIGKRKIDGCFSLGFGCHLSEEIAIKRAVTELSQMIGVMENNCAPFDFHSIKEESFLYPSKFSRDIISMDFKVSLSDSIELLVKQASLLGLEVLALNTSRADFPLKTVKIVIPGMCHMFPFLAAKRLYNVPVELGFLDRKRAEEELNNIELLI